MKLDRIQHARHPWRAHELVDDFTLIDLWEVAIEADPTKGHTLKMFFDIMSSEGTHTQSKAAQTLFKMREVLGRIFKWDDANSAPMPIPGCVETSVAQRLTRDDIARSLEAPGTELGEGVVTTSLVYRFEDEAMLEVSNKTIHALIHMGWVERDARVNVHLAIYIKSRGWMSRFYMALIKPFRHFIIYPAWIRQLTRTWSARHNASHAWGEQRVNALT